MSRWDWDEELRAFYGQVRGAVVKSVEGSKLTFEDGRSLSFELDGDCCSSSYFTDEAQFAELKGALILEIEERDGCADISGRDYSEKPEDDCVSWHFLVFVTDKGHVTIDWRNDSNGYYDGSVRPYLSEAKP